MKKFILLLFILINVSWGITLVFRFNNVDLTYMKTYFDFVHPFSNFNIFSLIRGHVLINFFSYLVFGLRPWGYYLIANNLHFLATVFLFFLLQRFFKDIKYAFYLSVIFGVSFVYSDVLFEGSFNQYYSIILSLFLFNLIILIDKRKTILISPLFFLIGLLFRETALLLPVISILFLFVFQRKNKGIEKEIITIALLVVISVVYLVFGKTMLGQLKSDLTDDAVQARMALIASRQYLKWALFASFNFLRMIAEQIIPYPVYYFFRDELLKFASDVKSIERLAIFYISLMGISLFFIISLLILKIIKSQLDSRYKKIALFGYSWIVLVNIFIAFVLPFPPHVISGEYNFESPLSRYNYYGFVGLVLIMGVTFKTKPLKLIKRFLFIYVLIQIVLIWIGGISLYLNKHAKARYFYNFVLSNYPSLPKQTTIYYNFFQVNNLRDYVGDLKNIYGRVYYPDTTIKLETGLSHVQLMYNMGDIQPDELLAFDLSPDGYLVDKTKTLRQVLENQREIYPVLVKKEGEDLVIELARNAIAKANLSYTLEFEARGDIEDKAECNEALSEYSTRRLEFLGKTKVESSSNYGDYPRFFFIKQDNLIDNQVSSDSYWQADIGDHEQAVTLDLGEESLINGLSWHSGNKYATPYDYSIFVSDDKINWMEIKRINGNKFDGRVERLNDSKARYVKFKVNSTSLGQPVYLREIEAINYPEEIFNKYDKFENLLLAAFNNSCRETLGWAWVSVVSETDQKTIKEVFAVFKNSSVWQKYSIPISNLEAFSNSREILDEELARITIKDIKGYEIKNVKLIPGIPGI